MAKPRNVRPYRRSEEDAATWRPFKRTRKCSGTLAICTCKYLGHRNIQIALYRAVAGAFKDFWRR